MAVASASAAAKTLPPPSSFAELLRRSRFASYDPAIAQTYASPQASARRGNYGLKRSIPMPYKDSFVTVNTFEHHAHFTDWNNADPPVKLVKRVEELNMVPHVVGFEWEQSLGEARSQWLIDSEFAEHDYSSPRPTEDGELDNPIEGNHSQLNIPALPPRQFQRYLNKLHDLSPEYREYILAQHQTRCAAQAEEESSKAEDELILYIPSQKKLHRQFLATHLIKSFTSPSTDNNSTDPEKIEPQPHRNGGLTYTHFSPLESVLTTHPQPGLILQGEPQPDAFFSDPRSTANRQKYLALFSGLVSRVIRSHVGNYLPFYNPQGNLAVGDTSIDLDKIKAENPDAVVAPHPDSIEDPLNMKKSSVKLRITKLSLRNPPNTVVGHKAHQTKPKEHLESMGLAANVAVDVELTQRDAVGNPYRIGSFEYSGHLEYYPGSRSGRAGGTGRYAPPGVEGTKQLVNRLAQITARRDEAKTTRRNGVGEGQQERNELYVNEIERSEGVKNTLKSIVDRPSSSGEAF